MAESFWDKLTARYNDNGWLMLFNFLGIAWNVTVITFATIVAMIAFFKLTYPVAFYAAVLWIPYVAAAAWHTMIQFHFPSGVADNIATAIVGLIGGGLGGLSWGYYWPFWLNCFFDKAALNPILLQTCLDANWLVMMIWLTALFVTIGGAVILLLSIGNAVFAGAKRKRKSARRSLTEV